MKRIFAVIPLVCAIVLISWGINKGVLVMSIIGGFCAGIYNSIITSKEE